MKHDLHCHTFFSPCAERSMTVSAILEAAEAAGLEGIGLTDHPHRPGLARHHHSLQHARATSDSPVRIWIGAELEMAGFQKLVMDRRALPDADYVLAAPSHYDLVHYPPVDHLDDPVEWADRLLTDLENVPGSGAQGIAHPFFVYSIVVKPPVGLALPLMGEIIAEIRPRRLDHFLEKCAVEGVALEISSRMAVSAVFAQFMEQTYRRAHEIGCRFFTGSDAHCLDRVGQLGKAADIPARLGLTDADFWHPGRR
jgi:histidinol phosphatase-like PHP family hydrolase